MQFEVINDDNPDYQNTVRNMEGGSRPGLKYNPLMEAYNNMAVGSILRVPWSRKRLATMRSLLHRRGLKGTDYHLALASDGSDKVLIRRLTPRDGALLGESVGRRTRTAREPVDEVMGAPNKAKPKSAKVVEHHPDDDPNILGRQELQSDLGESLADQIEADLSPHEPLRDTKSSESENYDEDDYYDDEDYEDDYEDDEEKS